MSVNRKDLVTHSKLSSFQCSWTSVMLRLSDHSTYTVYESFQCRTRPGRPCNNYVNYIQRLTGRLASELVDWHRTMMTGGLSWLSVLT